MIWGYPISCKFVEISWNSTLLNYVMERSYCVLYRKPYIRGLQLAAREPNLAREGQTIGPRSSTKNAEEMYYIFFKINFSLLITYIFLLIINKILLLVKFSSVMQDCKSCKTA